MKAFLLSVFSVSVLVIISSCQQAQRFDFDEADLNGDGVLDYNEASDALAAGIVEQYDTDGDQQISLAEWNEYHTDEKRFRDHDDDGDGFVTVAEIQKHARENETFRKIYNLADANGDGVVDREEAATFPERYYEVVR